MYKLKDIQNHHLDLDFLFDGSKKVKLSSIPRDGDNLPCYFNRILKGGGGGW